MTGMYLIRFASHHVLSNWAQSGRLCRSVAVIGAGESGQRLIDELDRKGGDEFRVAGVFDDRRTRVPTEIMGHALHGNIESAVSFVRRHSIELIVIALPLHAEERILDIVRRLRLLPVEITVSLDLVGSRLSLGHTTELAGAQVLRLVDSPLKDWNVIWKKVEDIVVASLVLLLAAPLMLMIAALIKMESRGPVLFSQARFGFNNHPVNVYKFRTMYADMADSTGSQRTTKNDVRVTRIGRFLRQTNLDELPQFINVLQGRLSVVGPRPHPLGMRAGDKLYHEAVAEYAVRHKVKPGITGWAQVNGLRGETDTMDKAISRIEHDLYYIDHWSLWLDLKIVFLTLLRGFNDPNAY